MKGIHGGPGCFLSVMNALFSVFMSVCLYVCLYVCLSVCLALPGFVSVCLSVYLSLPLYISFSLSPSISVSLSDAVATSPYEKKRETCPGSDVPFHVRVRGFSIGGAIVLKKNYFAEM